jgi:hypothetical protein
MNTRHSEIEEPAGATDANQEGADGSLPFIPLGRATAAVVLRLRTKLPRVKVASLPLRGRGTEEGSR